MARLLKQESGRDITISRARGADVGGMKARGVEGREEDRRLVGIRRGEEVDAALADSI